jgi:pyrroloquinoline quinone (PQQ) biosynthesis protein C
MSQSCSLFLQAIKRHMANRSLQLSANELRWISLHAELEVQHEGEVLEMCRALKQLDARAVKRLRAGAEDFYKGFCAFLDGMCQSYAHLGQRNEILDVGS